MKSRRAIFEKDPDVEDVQLEGDFNDEHRMVGNFPNYTMQWMDNLDIVRNNENRLLHK